MFHTLIIVGNVGRDPEMRYTPSGQAVTSFSVASNRRYTSSNGEQVNELSGSASPPGVSRRRSATSISRKAAGC
jgi:hypothetical protein